MSISNAMANAYSGLSASSRRADITANNIANANTEGYVRQETQLSPRVVAARGSGVQITGISRQVSENLTDDRRRAEATAGRESALSSAARIISDGVGGPDDPGALFARFEKLETDLRALSEAPQSLANQEGAARAAVDLVTGFNQAAEAITTVRGDAEAEIESIVNTVNNALESIEKLNSDIQTAVVSRRDTSSLEQQRDDAINSISEYIPLRQQNRDNGVVSLYTAMGATLLEGKAQEITFTRAGVVTPTMDFRAGIGGLSGLKVGVVEITPGGGAQGLTTGKLAGLFEVRDGTGLQAQQQLDGMASDLVSRFENSGVTAADGTGLFTDGVTTLDAANITGLSSRLAVNAAVDPNQGGEVYRMRDGFAAVAPGASSDPSNAEALLSAMTSVSTPAAATGLVIARSATGQAADFATLFETRAHRAENAQAASVARRETLIDSEIAVTGVDVDRELQELILIETAYAANAKVIQTMDRLINRLLEI